MKAPCILSNTERLRSDIQNKLNLPVAKIRLTNGRWWAAIMTGSSSWALQFPSWYEVSMLLRRAPRSSSHPQPRSG